MLQRPDAAVRLQAFNPEFSMELTFGRNNQGFAVIALPQTGGQKPVVVSLHLGQRNALSHCLKMQQHSGQIKFVVRPVRLNGLTLLEAPPQTPPPPRRCKKRLPRWCTTKHHDRAPAQPGHKT